MVELSHGACNTFTSRECWQTNGMNASIINLYRGSSVSPSPFMKSTERDRMVLFLALHYAKYLQEKWIPFRSP